jgi:hypothetical protein
MQPGTSRDNRAAWLRSVNLSLIRVEPNCWGGRDRPGPRYWTLSAKKVMAQSPTLVARVLK